MKRTLLALSTLFLIVCCKAQKPDEAKAFPFSNQLVIVEGMEEQLSLIAKMQDIKDLAQNNKNEDISVKTKDNWQLLYHENFSVVLKKKIVNQTFEIYASKGSSVLSTLNILDSLKLDIKSIDSAHLSSHFSTTKIPKSLDSGGN